MGISHELLSQFAKLVTKSDSSNTESTVYGTIIVDGSGNKYVKLDGSDQITPLSNDERPVADSTTANFNEGERVSVLIKNHTATITGNVSSPAARSGDVEQLGDQVSKIQEFDILIGDRIESAEGYIKQFQADMADIADLRAAAAKITELDAKKASIEELNAVKADITDLQADKIDADVVHATFATIENLNAANAKVVQLEATNVEISNKLTAAEADITNLEANKLSVNDANITYANIDFTNIGKAAIEQFYAKSGLIKDIVVGDGTITGELVGVTIKGDLIEANTLKADKLVVKGSDGLYYKLNVEAGATTSTEVSEEKLQNGLHGTAIIANTITAEKIAVDDLVAFDAKIGGFTITTDSIHSKFKESLDNDTQGIYLDSSGQMTVGDGYNYIKYYKDSDGTYKLAISAGSIRFSTNNKNVEEAIQENTDKIDLMKIGARNLIRNSNNLIFSNYYFSGPITSSHDGAGNVTITCGVSASSADDGYVTMRTSAVNSDDGAGNVTLT